MLTQLLDYYAKREEEEETSEGETEEEMKQTSIAAKVDSKS